MTTQLLDGPGVDLTFELRAAPTFLRVVQGPCKWDALDQRDDAPEPDEHVHVYRIVEDTWAQVFACARGRNRGASGVWESGEYRYVPDAPVELLRNNANWRAWVILKCAGESEAVGPLPAGVAADLARLDADAFREAAGELGAVQDPDDCWALA